MMVCVGCDLCIQGVHKPAEPVPVSVWGDVGGGRVGPGHPGQHEGETPVCLPEDWGTPRCLPAAHGGPG